MRNSCSIEIPATPEYVLEVLRDEHRQAVEFDDVCDRDIDLTFNSTIAQWRAANDLLPTRALGRALNKSWALALYDDDWASVLTPERKKTLRDVAKVIASHATRTQLSPLNIAGRSCLPAAAFLAVRDCLAADDVDVTLIAPSTLLHEYTRRHCLTFLKGISRLAPGALPQIVVKSFAHELNDASVCFSAVMFVVGIVFADSVPGVLIFAVLCLLLTTVHGCCIRNRPPQQATFGELRTFRDLSVCIANGAS